MGTKLQTELETTAVRRIIVFQPALPSYRVDFFERVAREFGENFSVYYSQQDLGSITVVEPDFSWACPLPAMRSVVNGLEWQPGVLGIPIRRGDVVVISGAPRNLSNMAMLLWARLKGVRTIWWGHYWSATSRKHRFLFRLLLMRLADALMLYSDNEVAEYRNTYGKGDGRPITALNNGINIGPIASLREPYEPELRERAVMFIGRLTKKARLADLLLALKEPALSGYTLHVVGDGPEGTALRLLASETGIATRVVWHGGTTDERVIAATANRCRLFVYPGSVGLSLIHAMAYGLPAIVHDDRWQHMPEIAAFENGLTGRSFKCGSVRSLAQTLGESLVAFTDLPAWAAESVKRASSMYNTEKMAFHFASLIAELGGLSCDSPPKSGR